MNTMIQYHTQRGFTLVELLIVIVIIGVLASFVLPALQSARDKAVDAKRISEADSVRKALEQYLNEYDEYPDDGIVDGEILLSALGPALAPEFMLEIPLDPVFGDTATGYKYCATDDLESYHLRIHLNDDGNASTSDYCGVQNGSDPTSACPSAAIDDLCSDRF